MSPRVTDEMRLPTQDLFGEKRLANLSEEKSPTVLSPEALIESDMCRGMQHACKAHQSMSKDHSYIKQMLSIDNN